MTNIDCAVALYQMATACEQLTGVHVIDANLYEGEVNILTDESLADYLLVNQIPYEIAEWDIGKESIWTHELTAKVGGANVRTLLNPRMLADLREKEAKVNAAAV